VAPDELASPLPDLASIHMLGGDAMVHHQSAGFDLLVQDGEIAVQIAVADMLEHADTDDLVKILAARQIAVVQQLQSDPVLQPGLRRASVGQLELRLAQGNATDLDIIETGRVARQSTPAAAHIQQSLAGFE